ncbi:MAG: beta-lactamase family protein [Ignavibacteriales bacterium]|nr:beta-lactamase family protein [Ignavibacteriales bacterium]
MKKLITKFVITLILTIGISTTVSVSLFGQTKDYEDLTQRVDSILKNKITENEPGVAVVVIKNGNIIYNKCYGLADIEHNIPITSKTEFNLASVSKQFTAFSILLLEKEGKLNLNDDIHKYIPELPDYSKPVTIQHLLNHTSGIWDYYDMMTTFGGYDELDHYTLNEVFTFLKKQKELLFDPGSQWVYSNSNYILLSQIIEKVTGILFRQWVKSNIFDPLDMKNSTFIQNSTQLISNRAGHYRKEDGEIFNYGSNWVNFCGHSHLYSNAEDMAKWMDNYRSLKIGGESIITKMFQKGKLNDGSESTYGNGVGIGERNGYMFIQHSGSTGGYKTFMIYCPVSELGITILANTNSLDVNGLGFDIFDLALGKSTISENISGNPQEFLAFNKDLTEKFSGGYLVEGINAKVAVNVEENLLHCAFYGLGEDDLFRTGDNSFSNILGENSIEFIDDDKQKNSKAILIIRGQKMIANRIEVEEKNNADCLNACPGNYYCDNYSTVYYIRLENSHLVLYQNRSTDMRLQQIDRDEFFCKLGFLKFIRNSNEEIVGFIFTPSSDRFFFQSVDFKRI